MLKQFRIENYKNFKKPLTVDFAKVGGYQFSQDCLTDNKIGKMLIYGRNATGKTNLGSAICDIAYSAAYLLRADETGFANAESEADTVTFFYLFEFDGTEIEYAYEKASTSRYQTERLRIGGLPVFDFNYVTGECCLDHLEAISSETIQVDRFLEALHDDRSGEEGPRQPICFLRWLFTNSAYDRSSPFAKMHRFVSGMCLMPTGALSQRRFPRLAPAFRDIDGENLQVFERFLNKMGIECRLAVRRLPDGNYDLYFRKGKRLLPFFESASSGTIALYNLYRRFVARMQSLSFCYIDEFDAFFHYEMSERFVRFFKQEYPDCQIIFTTHNTNLMTNRIMRPDCLFILSSDGRLTPLNEATPRELREGHNLEKMYISGEFERYE